MASASVNVGVRLGVLWRLQLLVVTITVAIMRAIAAVPVVGKPLRGQWSLRVDLKRCRRRRPDDITFRPVLRLTKLQGVS